MAAGSHAFVSDSISSIVSESWLQPPKLSLSREIEIDLLPILKVERGSPDDILPTTEFRRIMAECGIPLRDEYDNNFLEKLDDTTQESSSRFKSVDDAIGMTILSSISSAFPTTYDTISINSKLVWLGWRLSEVRSVEDTERGIRALVKKLVTMASGDKWLLRHMLNNDFDNFDGTWVSIICGLYQSWYMYQIEFVEEHCQSSQYFNEVLSKGKVMVLLLRQQHLQEFQYIVAERLLKLSTYERRNHIMEILGNKDFIVESLVVSVYSTKEKMGRWAEGRPMAYGIYQKTIQQRIDVSVAFRESFLANIFQRMMVCGLQDDKWLWKFFHNSFGSNFLCALYQALYLYSGTDKSNKEMIESNEMLDMEDGTMTMQDGKLVVLLFRSEHLQNFGNEETGDLSISKTLGRSFQRALIRTMRILQSCARETLPLHVKYWKDLQDQSLDNISFGLGKALPLHAQDQKDLESQDLGNVFLGLSWLPFSSRVNFMVNDPVDLEYVHTLGGLMCTIEGGPSNNEGNGCMSWCIIRIRLKTICFYFSVDLKDDEFFNKQRMLDGMIDVDFEGIVEVATENATTTVKSVELDGSYFDGSIEDFADMRGKTNFGKSCAAVALHTLSKKPFLGDYNLKCSTFHMIAMAFLAGNKNCLKLKWGGTVGHVEILGRDFVDQSPGGSISPLQKCTLLYTSNSTGLLGQDIIWKGDDGACSSREADESMRLKAKADIDKVKIILGHQSLWKYHNCLEVDFCKDHVEEILTETPNKQVSADEMAALAALKQNYGGGVGVLTVKVQANHEYRPPMAENILKKGLLELEAHLNYRNMIVYGHLDLFNEKLCTLQAELENGSIQNNEQEIFVVRTDHSRCLQIFACNERPWPGYEHSTYYDFTWITDFVAKDLDAAERIMKCTLKGKEVKIQRMGPTLRMEPKIDEFKTSSINKLIDRFKQKLAKYEDIVIKDQTMVHGSDITWKKIRASNDGWQFIIGKQKDFSRKNYFFHSTEMQAAVCSATYYTTGGAILRTEVESAQNSNQPSTSANLVASSGSCRMLCKASRFLTNKHEVTAIGRFSTCKSQDVKLQKKFYWG